MMNVSLFTMLPWSVCQCNGFEIWEFFD